MDLTQAEKLVAVNRDGIEVFLKYFGKGVMDGGSKECNKLPDLLKAIRETPVELFFSGLKVASIDLQSANDEPLKRLTLSPHNLFVSGMVLGYALTCASEESRFKDWLEELTKTPQNVTDIRQAKKS